MDTNFKWSSCHQGDFLPEERYLPWAESRREELKGRYVEVLERLAELHEKGGVLTKAINCLNQLLKADPLWEPAYQKLMLLYARRGLRAPALKVYESCRQALRQGLDIEPDQVTTAIYRKILTSS